VEGVAGSKRGKTPKEVIKVADIGILYVYIRYVQQA
jgi:hypothetical protein